MTQLTTAVRQPYRSISNGVLFAIGVVVLLLLDKIVYWMVGSAFSPTAINWTVEPILVIGYLLVGGHLLFDYRPAFEYTESGTRRALQTAAAVYILGYLWLAVEHPPTALAHVGGLFIDAYELCPALIQITVPIVYGLTTTRETLPAFKAATVLTGITATLPGLALYIEAFQSPIGYAGLAAMLTDPLLELSIGLVYGMLNGIVIAAVMLAVRGMKRRAKGYQATA